MKTAKPLLLIASICFAFTGTSMCVLSQAAGVPEDVPLPGQVQGQILRARLGNETDRIIVKYRQAAAGAAAISRISQQVSQATGHGMSHQGSTGTGAQIFTLEETLSLEDIQGITREIEADPNVEYAEPDKRIFPLYTPTDPRYNEQWHYYADIAGIRLPEAWDASKGDGVIVAVIDTGYTEHADLVDNLQLPGYDLMNDTTMSNDGDGRDQDAHDPGDWSPECGLNVSTWHGTHTSGTVAAIGDNGFGIIGAAFNAKVLPVRVLGKCGGWMSEFADGIVWAAGGVLDGVPTNPTPAQVLNLSLGGISNGCSHTMQQAVDLARGLGSTIVVAAGNTDSDVSGFEPANCSGVISVAATDRDGNRASFSNHGDGIDIAAPGVRILSTLNSGTTTPEVDTYVYYHGTSTATPLVSGTAALLYAVKPDITPAEVEQILKDTARPFPGTCDGCGAGLLDAAAAVAAVSQSIPDPQSGLTLLQNAVAQTDLSGLQGDGLMFAIDVPDNAANLTFTMSGGSGDADLHVRFESEPTLNEFDCRPYLYGNDETCQMAKARTGRYYVLIHGYTDFSGVSLLATYEESSDPDPDPVTYPVTGSFENTDDFAIPDFSLNGVESPIDVALPGISGTVDVHVEIKHSSIREILVMLVSPNGQRYILSLGDMGENLSETYTLNLGSIPASGIWKLQAIDFGNYAQGYIDSWSITFQDQS